MNDYRGTQMPLKIKLSNAKKPFVKLTAGDVLTALRKRHPRSTQWVFLTEVAFATGFGKGSDNHIDAMAFNCWPSAGLDRIAYEVKVSREDYKRELKDPGKRQNAVEHSNHFFFAAPAGLIDVEDLPIDCGLIEVNEKLECSVAFEAPKRKEAKFSYPFFLAVLRNAQDMTMRRQDQFKSFRAQMDMAIHGFDDRVFFKSDAAWAKYRDSVEGRIYR